MWSIHLCGSSTCGGFCVKCKFAQRWLRKMQICATILQIYSNLQGAEVVPPPKEVVPPPKEVVHPPKEVVPPPMEVVPPPKEVVTPPKEVVRR